MCFCLAFEIALFRMSKLCGGHLLVNCPARHR